MIDDDLIQQLLGASSLLLSTASHGRPRTVRSSGTRFVDGLLRIPLLRERSGWVLDALRDNPRVSVLYCHTDCLASYQIKGHAVDLVAVEQADLDVALAHFAAFAASLERMDGRDFSNLRIEADAVLRIRPERVFDQTPGPAAGALLRYAQEVGGPWRGLERPASDAAPPPAASVLAQDQLFSGAVPPTFVTADPAGMPNAIYVSRVDVLDRAHVALSRQFFRKTAENLARNPFAVIGVGDPETNRMYLLEVRHLRTETSGPLFERMSAEIDVIASLIGASGLFRLQAADVFEVLAEQEMAGFVRDAPPTAGRA